MSLLSIALSKPNAGNALLGTTFIGGGNSIKDITKATPNKIFGKGGTPININDDPNQKEDVAAQREALKRMLANSDASMTEAEKANLDAATRNVRLEQARAMQGIANRSEAMGTGGSGIQASLQAQGEQNAANAVADVGSRAQLAAQARALQSLSDYSNLATGSRQQGMTMSQFNEELKNKNRQQNMNLFGTVLGAGAAAFGA